MNLATNMDRSLMLSRAVLLGSRDLEDRSCVTVVTKGEVYNLGFDNYLDADGGPGSTITALYSYERQDNNSPLIDFKWFQGRLKTYLENQSVLNAQAGESAGDIADQAIAFYEEVRTWTEFPADFRFVEYSPQSNWPSYCLGKLNRAIENRNLQDTRRWAGELAGASHAVADLHRWLDFLVSNHLVAVNFQKQCQEVFQRAEKVDRPYEPMQTVSDFPAGVVTGNGRNNYYEVERQAEQLFTVPPNRLERVNDQTTQTDLVWIMPELRKTYLEWRSQLNPANQQTLDLAARSPFHRSYLMNMLFRSQSAKTVGRMRLVLRKFDANYPNAAINEIMDVLMYRGHSFAGLEWDDRFQPELTAVADAMDPAQTSAEAILKACDWTYQFFDPDHYAVTYTLRESIMQKKLDCVRATDMIGTIFRNAGRAGFGHVRWCSESAGHSVAAYLGFENDQTRTLIVDGLNSAKGAVVWPDAYFNGAEWPPNLVQNQVPYAVELYGRGIDSYIWLEGYIMRGPNAGNLTIAAVPYMVGREKTSTQKVFAGPYPSSH